MVEPLIIARKINKFYGETVRTHVLFDIDLSIDRNSFTVVIGPSGSGKSTLLNILSLLEPPTSGEVIIRDIRFAEKTTNQTSGFRNDNIGFVFQFHYLLPEFTALENILMPYWVGRDRPPENVVQRALSVMKRIGIYPVRDKYPAQMSGGEQQRVAIARALTNRPQIIFADEPTGNLDRETSDAVLSVLGGIVREEGATLVMVTHDREIALRADRIIELIDGQVCKSFLVRDLGADAARELLDKKVCLVP